MFLGKNSKITLTSHAHSTQNKPSRFDPYSLPFPPRKKQQMAFEEIDKQNELLCVLPTGYGKTNIALYAFQKSVDSGKKCLILFPLKALVEEMKETFGKYFNLLPLSSDYRANKKKIMDKEVDGIAMTFEMAYQYSIYPNRRNSLFSKIEWIIIDEAHLIGMEDRGAILESFIYIIKKFNPSIKFCLLSATIGNYKDVSTHFNLSLIHAPPEERPVPLFTKVCGHVHTSKKEEMFQLIISTITNIFKKFDHENQSSIPNMLVFCNSRSLTRTLAEEFEKSQKIPFSNGDSIKVGYHNAGLTKEERIDIEKKFREGHLNMLFTTPTLAMGVNVPADIVLITDVKRTNPLTWTTEFLSASEIIQMVGRAGRGGKFSKLKKSIKGKMQPYGKAYILCEFDNITYIESVLEESMYVSSQINSSLKYLHLTWVNAGITTRDGLEKIHEGILLESGITDEGKKSIGKLKSEKKFDEAHLWLQKKRFFTEINKNLSLQHKGKVVAAFAISPRTTLYFLDIKRKLMAYTKSIDPPTLFAILFCADEFCSVVRTDEKIDANILYNGKKFVNIQVLEEIIGEGKKESIKILKSIKAFSYVFHSYIMERYGMDPHITLKYMRLTGGEITILQSIGNRMILSAHMLLGEFWKYGRPLRVLKKGISLSPPIFDEDVYHLIQIPGCGIKTSTLLAECKFNSLEDVISSSSNKIENTVRKHVRRKNSHINKLNSLKKSGAKVKNWGLVSRKKIEKIQLTIITRGGVDTSNLPPNLLNNVKNKQQKLNI